MICQCALTGHISFIMFFELYLQYVTSNTKLKSCVHSVYVYIFCSYKKHLQKGLWNQD